MTRDGPKAGALLLHRLKEEHLDETRRRTSGHLGSYLGPSRAISGHLGSSRQVDTELASIFDSRAEAFDTLEMREAARRRAEATLVRDAGAELSRHLLAGVLLCLWHPSFFLRRHTRHLRVGAR